MKSARKAARKPARSAVARKGRAPKKKTAAAVHQVVDAMTEDGPAAAVEVVAIEVAAMSEPAVVAEAGASHAKTAPAGLKLEASCTLRDSIDMQFQLLAVDFGDSDVVVDGSAVERIDTAGLQLLLSFAKHQAGRGKPVRWAAVSPELLRGSQLLGVAGMLGIEDPASGSETRGN